MNTIVRLRDFIYNWMNTSLSVFRILVLSKFNPKIPKSTFDECVILGNGPSLKNQLENRSFLSNKSKIAVNYFARTDEFTEIKPDIYVICSPEYFTAEKKKDYRDQRIITLNAIAEKTTWPMFFVVPALAKKNREWRKPLEQNKNVHIIYMNTTPVEGFNASNNFFFRKLLGMPRPHNVLVPSVWLAINIGFKKIYLAGADHSWLPEVWVTEENEVLLSQKHFYDKQTTSQTSDINKPTPKPMFKGTSEEKRKLHEVLEKFYLSFKSYWVLRSFADNKKVDVYNITKGSFIDAFDRLNIDS
ncbi:MAG: hypothetical protein NXI20_21770 [bacterium]|nr:hypothetical protein [bacterium]